MSVSIADVVSQLVALPPAERAAAISAFSRGLDAHLGLTFTWCDEGRVVATLEVGAQHTQVYGLVHGGVYCTLVEAVGSCGAAMLHLPEGRLPVGAENHTRFIKAARAGTMLTAVGTPLSASEAGSTWTVSIHDAEGVLCAEGTLRARALPPGQEVGGASLRLPVP